MKKYLFLLFLFCFPAYAGKAEDIEFLAKEAYEMYPLKNFNFSMPYVEFVPVKELYERVCKQSCPPGFFIKGLYSNGKISLRDNLDLQDIMDSSFVIHEMVHFFQEKSGVINEKTKLTCEENVRIELQAYMIQNQWLLMRGTSMPLRAIQQLSYASSGACASE